MSCYDCVHLNVCKAYEPEEADCICNQFKNKADFVEVKDLSPCDVCEYNPPSSFDGKPCALCPAKKKGEIHNG